MPDAVMTTVRLRDVAAAAGVDASVVSRVLSGDRRLSIRPETRQRVLEAATRLNYRPNTAARALKTARTMAIGMIVPDFANVNYATIAQGAEEQAATAGYALLVAGGSPTERLGDLHGRIDGLLVGMATSETPRLGDFGGGVPALLVNRREPCGIASVTVDDEAGAFVATQYLASPRPPPDRSRRRPAECRHRATPAARLPTRARGERHRMGA